MKPETLLVAVGACQAITAAFYAAFLEIPIKRYEFVFKGYADLAGFYGVSENRWDLSASFAK